MDECEDGEILDFDDEDDVYTPLERPSRPEPPCQQPPPPPMMESESDDGPQSSSSDSDSSSGPTSTKKRKVRLPKGSHQCTEEKGGPVIGSKKSNRNSKYNIWAASLQEETIVNELENITGLQKFSRERGVESYDFTQIDDREEDDNLDDGEVENEDVDIVEEPPKTTEADLRSKLSNKRRRQDRGHVKKRLGRRPSPSDSGRSRDHAQPRTILDLTKTAEDDSGDVATDIANKLLENKEDLICRVVEVLGKEKAISLFEETQKIESQGGMLIMNGSRRRSPGGVFLFLLKGSDTITEAQKNEIFGEEVKKNKREIRKSRRQNIRRRVEEERLQLKSDGDLGPVLPDLLTRAELVVQQASGKLKLGDGLVSNPPPSPATDNRGESSNDSPPHITNLEINNRAVADYENDFLDVYGDNMDEF